MFSNYISRYQLTASLSGVDVHKFLRYHKRTFQQKITKSYIIVNDSDNQGRYNTDYF